jgi:hypothetical protein
MRRGGMMNIRIAAVASAAVLLLARAEAHHSFAAGFDSEKPFTVSGSVAGIEWANPHMHFVIDVKGDDGKLTRWRFEGYPPNMLVRQGWQKDVTMKVGDDVTVTGWLARSEPNLGAVRNVTFADGRKLAAGPPAGTGGR